MKWEISKAVNDAQAITHINSAERPFGLVVFGADSALKQQVTELCIHCVDGLAWANRSNADQNAELVELLAANGYNLMVALNGEESTQPAQRQHIAQILRSSGAETVIGIYVKSDYIPESQIPIDTDEAYRAALAHNDQVDDLTSIPPSPAEFDFLCIVSADPDKDIPSHQTTPSKTTSSKTASGTPSNTAPDLARHTTGASEDNTFAG